MRGSARHFEEKCLEEQETELARPSAWLYLISVTSDKM